MTYQDLLHSKKLLKCVAGKEVEILKISLESNSIYSFHPSMFLHHDKDLQCFEAKIFLQNTVNYKLEEQQF